MFTTGGSEILLGKVNSRELGLGQTSAAPVMATPAAFVAGFALGAKAAAVTIAAAAGGAAIANNLK